MRTGLFPTVRTEGGLLPPDILVRVVERKGLDGTSPDSYGLDEGLQVNEAVARSWNRLLGVWTSFRNAREKLPEHDLGVTITRQKWLLPLFEELRFGRVQQSRPQAIDGKNFAIYSLWNGRVPLHLQGFGVELDRRTEGVAGAAGTSPHGLVQEYLNRDDASLWGVVSNGLRLRLLRDSARIARQSFVEFDLESMMDGEVYGDFALLWMLCHQSRFEGERPDDCWLERWSRAAQEEGTRALDQLRGGVEEAINALGSGFLAHPANGALRERLRDGALSKQDYYRQLLRLVYRLIFLFAAEDRGVLLLPGSEHEAARSRYLEFYSTARLRRLAGARRGTAHYDLYETLKLLARHLDDDDGCPALALPGLGSFLWSPEAIPDLTAAALPNTDLLAAVRHLAWSTSAGTPRPVDYRNMGAEELGSVYESLLELQPDLNLDEPTFALRTVSGSERKTTGSYYTPSSLIECLLDSALEPVIDAALREASGKPEDAILRLRVCDPACGSGHFLIGAAHRLARRLAAVRSGDAEPAPGTYRAALRDVIGRCLFGVDLNPMAVELCKVSLWLEAMEPGKPLSFMEHHVRCGNSLTGTTPDLIAAGLPDEAFDPIEGDDKKIASALKKRNREERERPEQAVLGFESGTAGTESTLVRGFLELESGDEAALAAQRRRAERFAQLAGSEDVIRARTVADAWCAAFVWPKSPGAPAAMTTNTVRALARNPRAVPAGTRTEVERLAQAFRFFHWHLEFPVVFADGGFDVVLGNPPWERVKLQEKEWFAARDPDIATAPNKAAREKLIAKLQKKHPELHEAFLAAVRVAEGQSQFLRASARYPLCGRGDVNTYTVFAELKRSLLSPRGRVGCLVPSGIATDDTTKFFFQDLVDSRSLVSLFDFENRQGLFPAVDSRMKFCLLTMGGRGQRQDAPEFVFFAHRVGDLADPEKRFTLTAEDIALLNPNTRTCPIFRTRRDAEITKAIYRRVPVFLKDSDASSGGAWRVAYSTPLHLTNDAGAFEFLPDLTSAGWKLRGAIFHKGSAERLPVYEGRMISHFDHRAVTVGMAKTTKVRTAVSLELSEEQKQDPESVALPRYWVDPDPFVESLGDRRDWFLAFKDVTSATNERTVVPAVIPRCVPGNSCPVLLFDESITPAAVACLAANLGSFVLDYVARSSVGGVHINFYLLKQFPLLPPVRFSETAPWATQRLDAWISARIAELSFTASDLTPFGRALGYPTAPFQWNSKRRFLLRCELDAAFFVLYGASREEASHILDTFPIVKERDEKTHGEYRTKRVILETYDALESSARSGRGYVTSLSPPPGNPLLTSRITAGR